MELLGLSLTELQNVCAEEGFPKFTAKQLCDWLYVKRVDNFDAMTNLSLKIRGRFKEIASIGRSEAVGSQLSSDGTVKYLFKVGSGRGDAEDTRKFVETVYIPDGERATLCVSCQAGCRMGCRFCSTGASGYRGNLSVADILNQIFSIPQSDKLTNIVFMGMGEPLDNFDAVLQTIKVLTSEWGWAWSPHRITVSTVGVTPMMRRLLEECDCDVAISLHNAVSAERKEIVPMEKVYPMRNSVELLKNYNWNGQRRLTFEYTMFRGINDDIAHAAEIAKLLRGLRCRINLIRFHYSPGMPFQASDRRTMETFCDWLNNHGVICTIRASRGEDISAACGLLATSGQ